jgi:hypothetical protein
MLGTYLFGLMDVSQAGLEQCLVVVAALLFSLCNGVEKLSTGWGIRVSKF